MLDILISYINFLILAISYIIKKFAYQPPNPPEYKIIKENSVKSDKIFEKEEIIFLFKKDKDNNLIYRKVKPNFLDINFFRITKDNFSLPVLKISPKNPRPICIIYFQGNSGDLGSNLYECYEISKLCRCYIITFEYPGYGICQNDEIKESEFFKRTKIIYNYITENLKFKPNQIILYGFSLGTGIAFDFACRKDYPIAGLILQSPFLSIMRTMYNIKKTRYYDLFNNCDKAERLCTKTLFIHGIQDTIVPYVHGRILAKLIPEKYFYDFLTVLKADHNNLLKENKYLLFKYIRKFISFCTKDITNPDYINDKQKIFNIDININEDKDEANINSVSLTKSEESGFKDKDETKQPKVFSENEKKLKEKFKSISYISYPIRNKIKLSNINQNNFENQSLRYSLQIKNENNNESKNVKEKENFKQKLVYLTKNNYHTNNNGIYVINNKSSIYNNYNKSKNRNKNNINEYIENSLASMYSSTNNITNSTTK